MISTFPEGTLNSVSTAPCGLDSDGGTWTTDLLEKPAAQDWGRLHLEYSDEDNGTVDIEYKDSQGAWVSIQEGTKPIVSSALQLRFTITNTCLTKAWIDINDPKIRVQGVLQVMKAQCLKMQQDGLLLSMA